MRLFTAIDLPPEVIGRLDGLIAKLRPLARIGWSPAANLHITTKFIGQWPEERLPQLTAALSGVGCRAPIPIRVGGLGFFPNRKSPRVFWAGVEAPAELGALARDTDATLAKLDRRVAERVADLEKLATSRADFLRLLRADRKLEQLKLEHDIVYWRLPEERRARHRPYIDDNYRRRHGIMAELSTTPAGVGTG